MIHIFTWIQTSLNCTQQENRSLKRVDLAWNGFGFEGCVALSDTLARNYILEDLDISSNRVNPPALMELLRGLARNKTLKALRVRWTAMAPTPSSTMCVDSYAYTLAEMCPCSTIVVFYRVYNL